MSPLFYERLASLPVHVDGCTLARRQQPVSSGFLRVTTLVQLTGDDARGWGEDVTYEAEDHDALLEHGPPDHLAGAGTLEEMWARLDGLRLFPVPPRRPDSRHYRRWAFESALLDLALRQSGLSLDTVLGLAARPLQFVVSLRLGEPPDPGRVTRLLAAVPGLRFKLDPTSSWTDALVEELAATGAVACLDLKGAYQGTVVDQAPDPELYQRVVEAFPRAWFEDPAWTPATEAILRPHQERITWDAIIHGVEDIAGLPFRPRALNFKPSRFGRLRNLLDAYEHCRRHGIAIYGGGQFELGPGRGQIQRLAALLHPDAPNDVAPAAFHDPDPAGDLPAPPLVPPAPAPGFAWDPDDPGAA